MSKKTIKELNKIESYFKLGIRNFTPRGFTQVTPE